MLLYKIFQNYKIVLKQLNFHLKIKIHSLYLNIDFLTFLFIKEFIRLT